MLILRRLVDALVGGFAFFLRADFAEDLGAGVDVEPPAGVEDIAADDALVHDLGAVLDEEVAGDVAEDVDPALVQDGQVAVDGAAQVKLRPLDGRNVAGDRAPQGEGLVDHHLSLDVSTLLTHASASPPRLLS